jgi:ribosomal protein S14
METQESSGQYVHFTELPLADRIRELILEIEAEGDYVTVRKAAKKLDVKQAEIMLNVPDDYKLLPASNGGASEQRFALKSEEDYEVAVSQDIAESNEVHEQVAKMLPKRKERVKKVEKEAVATEVQYDEEGNPIPQTPEAENGEKVICAICGNPVRKNTIVRRGICPLCFRQLAKNVGMNATKLEALSDEEFEAVLGEENGRRRTQEERKVERTLTAEDFKAREGTLIPVKELFAAGREAGYGPGRIAQAVGGDRFRHDPVGGYGSVWTPYFYGARNAWYFDKDILNHFDDLQKPAKPAKEKSTSGKTAGVGRKGARGAAMTPVVEDDGANPQDIAEMEETPEAEV